MATVPAMLTHKVRAIRPLRAPLTPTTIKARAASPVIRLISLIGSLSKIGPAIETAAIRIATAAHHPVETHPIGVRISLFQSTADDNAAFAVKSANGGNIGST